MNFKGNEYDAVIASFCLPHLSNEEAEKLVDDIGVVLCKVRNLNLLWWFNFWNNCWWCSLF